jgi:hypothetical protein
MNKDVKKLVEAYTDITRKKNVVNEVVFPELINKTPHIKRHVLASGEEDGEEQTNLTSIDKKIMLVSLENAYATKQPLLIFGPPGNAKSQTVIQFAEKIAKRKTSIDGTPRVFKYWNKCQEKEQSEILQNPGKYFVLFDVRTVRYDPTDITGVPIAIPDSIDKNVLKTMKYPWIVLLCKPEIDGVLFFDEINQGSKAMMNLLMSITLDRDFDGVPMSKNIGIFAAGNLEGGYSTALPPALMNRFSAGVLTLDPEDWLEWAEGSINREDGEGEDESSSEEFIGYSAPTSGTRVDSWITSFVRTDLKRYRFVKPVTEGNKPFESWRAFQKLSDKMRYIEQKHEAYRRNRIIPQVDMYDEVAHEAAMLCGVDWAQDFMIYIGYTSRFNVQEIIKDPKKFIEDHLKEPKTDSNGKPITGVDGKDVKALKRGRVYSFITWVANKSVEAFKHITSDPTYKVLVRDASGNTAEQPSSYIPLKTDVVVGVKSREIDEKVPGDNTSALLAFGRAFAEVLESNDDKAVLKDGMVKLLGGVLKWGQFVLSVAQTCKNTGVVDINALKKEIEKAKQAATRVSVTPVTSTTSSQSISKDASSEQEKQDATTTSKNLKSFVTLPKPQVIDTPKPQQNTTSHSGIY